MKRTLSNILLLTALLIFSSCQVPVQPDDLRVKARLQVKVHDQSNQPVVGSDLTLTKRATSEGVSGSADPSTGTWTYALDIPIIGEAFRAIAIAPLATATTTYTPTRDTVDFTMPCRDTILKIQINREDLIPCGSTFNGDMDFETICIDRDTTVELIAGPFTHNCPTALTIGTINTPSITGLTVTVEIAGTPVNAGGSWSSGAGLVIRANFNSAAHQNVVFDNETISLTATPSTPATSIIINLSGKGIRCDKCECPNYDSVSFGLNASGIDTNVVDLSDAPKSTQVDLSKIVNSNDAGCDLVVSQIKQFSRSELRVLSFGGASGATSATIPSHSTLGGMTVEFTPLVRGELVDTMRLRIQKRASDGTISDCDTVPVIYHGKVTQGICVIDTIKTDASQNSYLKNDTISNCIDADDDFKTLCIKNIGDGRLRFDLRYLIGDPQFRIKYDNGAPYNGEDIFLAPNATQCFTLRFVPDGNRVRATNPFTVIFNNTLAGCTFNLPVVGRAFPQCIHCLDGAISKYGVTSTSFGGIIFDGPDAFRFNSTPGVTPDIYASDVNVGTQEMTLVSTQGTTFAVVPGYTISGPGKKFCDDPVPAAAKSLCGTAGTTSIIAKPKQLILFESNGRCGLIYIDTIYDSNGIPVAVFQASYPIN